MKRRAFFKRFAAIVAAVALAPEIAFNVRLDPTGQATLNLHELIDNLYKLAKARRDMPQYDFYTDANTAKSFIEQLAECDKQLAQTYAT